MIEQRSQEWFKLRLGKVTASRINHVITDKKNSISRAKYLRQLVDDEMITLEVAKEKAVYPEYFQALKELKGNAKTTKNN